MGLLKTRWEASYQGHAIVVERNEIGRGFRLDWDGTEIARRSWTWIGLGELHASAEIGDRHADVVVTIEWGGLNGTCTVNVDGQDVPVTLVK
jgi:hypothetical protein